MTRVGIIGLGMMGRTHFEAYESLGNVKVVAIADENPARAAGDLTGTGGNVLQGGLTKLPMDRIKGYTDYKQLIASDIDVIDICVPTPAHAELAIAAIKSGKHVVCEKPLGRTLADAQRIAEAAASCKGAFMPAMCMRFWPAWAWLKKAVEQKTYGKVLGAQFQRCASLPGGWFGNGKMSGGAILDLHIHDTDFVNFLFGKPQAVYSRGYTKATGEIDHVSTHYIYKDVPLVIAEGGWVMSDGYGFRMRYTVNFEKATADFDIGRPDQLILHQAGKSTPIDCGSNTGYVEELKYFIDCITKGQKPKTVTAQDGVSSIAIVTAEIKSIATGQPVTL
jgi:predicted dehydrogenase